MPDSPPSDNAMSLGSCLREQRESRGITLDDAARVTRIGKNYLAALEGERFDVIPNPAYAKGFLRAYAEFLGLSGDFVVALYDRNRIVAESETPVAAGKPGRKGIGPSFRPLPRFRWAVPLVLLVLALGVSYFFRGKESVQEKNLPGMNNESPVPGAPAPVQVPRSSAVSRPASAAGSNGAGSVEPGGAQPETAGGGIVLKLKANQDSSLNVMIDGSISQQYDLKSGDLIEWKADRGITLDIGNAGGVEAEFNGRPLRPFGEPGKSAHVVLKADTPVP